MQEKAGKAGVVSQYIEVYCDCGAKARLDCIAIQCPAKPRYGQEVRSRRVGGTGLRTLGARGRAGEPARRRAGSQAGALQERHWRADVGGRRVLRQHGCAALGERCTGCAGRGRALDLGVLLGQWAVHLVLSACFDPV